MGMSIERSRTPPSSYLLTPPPTGGFSIRVRFADANLANIKSKQLTNPTEGESPSAFFEDPQRGPDIDISEEESISSTDNISLASPISTATVTSKSSIVEKHDLFASLAVAIDALATMPGPFPFMKLPLSVRNKVYEHLLVVPALICVRQNHTSFHDEKKAFLYAERRELLPGFAYALAQLTVDGYKVRFSRFATSNINILCVNKEVRAEARPIMYRKNHFEIVKPTNEMSPSPDFGVHLFPSGCQRLVTALNIRIRSFYDLHWLLSGGYNVIKNHYRGLSTLTLILELDSANKGFGKRWSKKEQEKWTVYIKRLQGDMSHELFEGAKMKKAKVIPTWVNLCVLFSGESYDEKLFNDATSSNADTDSDKSAELIKRDELRAALVEAWELFKKGGR